MLDANDAPRIEGLIHAIVDRLGGLDLAHADIALDDVRRLVWMVSFSGGDREKLRQSLGTHPVAGEIAAVLAEQTIEAASAAIEIARLIAWGAVMGGCSQSAFRSFVDAFTAEPVRPAHLN